MALIGAFASELFMCFYISVIHISGLKGQGMSFQDQENMLIKEYVFLGKIRTCKCEIWQIFSGLLLNL